MFTCLYRVCTQSSGEGADYTHWDPSLLSSTRRQLTLVNIFRISLHVFLPSFICILIIVFVLICTGSFVNKIVLRYEVHQNTWGRVLQAWKQVWKQNNDIPYFQLKWLIGVDAGRYADDCWWIVCTCAVVFPPKWCSRLLWHHLMMSQESLMCKREGSIKRGSTVERGVWLLLCCHLGI